MRSERRPGRWPRKAFVKGEMIEVQRSVGSRWEPATYDKAESRGWHRVDLAPDAKPRLIDSMTGEEMLTSNARTYETRVCKVPTQRARKVGI